MIFADTTWQDCLMYALIAGFAAYNAYRLETSRMRQKDMKVAVNGRMEDLIASAREAGFADGRCKGIAEAAKAVGDNPKIPMEAQEVLKSVAQASNATLTPPVKPQ